MYIPAPERYERASFYRRCGRSGIRLPLLSLGLWQNFGGVDSFENGRALVRRAFDLGITHFALANNYGPPAGSAEENFGQMLRLDLKPYRDELIISTKAGYEMWPGPYGNWGSRKFLLASLDQSLRRLGVDYVDIFYHHRPDPETPLEETMGALAQAVRSGKALYVGLSNYRVPETQRAVKILRELGTPCLIHEPRYNLFDRWIEGGLLDTLEAEGIGCIPFSPLAQGILTDRYLAGIPPDARAAKERNLRTSQITEDKLVKVRALDVLARERGHSLARLAVAWALRDSRVTSVLIGASKLSQLDDTLQAPGDLPFSSDEIAAIDKIMGA